MTSIRRFIAELSGFANHELTFSPVLNRIPLKKLTVKDVLQAPMGSAIAISSLGVQGFVISIVVWIYASFDAERL